MLGSRFAGNSLVKGHLENLSREMLVDDDYRKILNDYVKDQCGIYALYKDDRLKYVGLAANLPGRLAAHLRDRHGDSWNRFSVYITHDDEHMKELESLILRITQPKGNKVRGRLKGSENLERKIKRDLTTYYKELHRDLFAFRRKTSKAVDGPDAVAKPRRTPQLAGYAVRPFRIRLKHKGTVYEAVVQKDGSIKYGTTVFTSPSIAGARIIGRRTLNGWTTWKFQNDDGEWVVLDELRKSHRARDQKRRPAGKVDEKYSSADTIICPAKEDGFQETFIGENCWYKIRLQKKRIPYIKYLAIYRVRPISAITHYAKVERIALYKNTGKYIVFFKGSPRKIGPIPTTGGHGPQGPFFSNLSKLKAARSLSDL